MDVEITGGVPQFSFVVPLLWNAIFDSVLRGALPQGATSLGFEDDTLIVVSSKTVPELETLANAALSLVGERITKLSLQIATRKNRSAIEHPPRRESHLTQELT